MATSQTIPERVQQVAAAHHQPELDGIRGIAILAVMLSHGAGLMGVLPHHTPHSMWVSLVAFVMVPGWGGVDLFFTLSGFLITGILLRARERATYFSSFYARRVLRIFPVYYLFLVLTLIAGHVWPVFGTLLPSTAKERVSYFLYLQNWPLFWPNWLGLTSLWGIFWSLAVEEQFYLVWPTFVRLLDLRAIMGICLVGFVLGTPLRWFVIHRWTGISVGVLHFPLSRLDGLFVGAACALYREMRGRAVPLRWAGVSFWTGAFALLYIGFLHIPEYFGIGIHITTFGIAGFALMSGGLIVASQHPLPWLQRVLTLRPLTIAGKYSYGMYVYHLLIYSGFSWLARRLSPATGGEFEVFLALAYIAVAILVTTAVAAASYHLFEERFLKLKRFFPSPNAPTAG
jgi:peptidoglycan/LPS O-acetylase OafA/YrhL